MSFFAEQYNDKEAWRAARPASLGASEVAVAMGLSPHKSAFALWAEKTSLAAADELDSEAIEWGQLLEEPIAQKYARVTGRTVIDHGRYAMLRSVELPFMTATLDREVAAWDERGPAALEIKTTGAFRGDDWLEDPPLHVQTQLQAQLLVTGWRHGSIAVLIGGQKFRYVDVPRHNAFIALMIERCARFWACVQSQTPPPVDDSLSTLNALRRMYPKESGETVALSRYAETLDRRRALAERHIKRWERVRRAAENKLRAQLGAATYGVTPTGITYSLKTVNVKAHNVAGYEARRLTRLEKAPS